MWKLLCWFVIWNSSVCSKLIIQHLSDFSWLEYSGILRKVEARILLLWWAFSLKLHQNLRKNLLFQAYVLIHQRPTRFRGMIILVKSPRSPRIPLRQPPPMDSSEKVWCWHLLLWWAFSLKLHQKLRKNLLFQTYLLIQERPTRFGVIIILVKWSTVTESGHIEWLPLIVTGSYRMVLTPSL